jgi:uncharacterized damage-inducible protein DinB
MTYYTGSDLARSFRTVRQNTIQIARDIPESQYGFRATPDTRTVAELLAHIAAQSRWTHRLHGVDRRTSLGFEDFRDYIAEANTWAAALTSPAAILAALEHEGQAFATWLESLTEADLAEPIRFSPPADPAQKSRFEMLLGTKEHEMHHRGQLMLMQRILGVVPHLTRARQARVAAAPAAAGKG